MNQFSGISKSQCTQQMSETVMICGLSGMSKQGQSYT